MTELEQLIADVESMVTYYTGTKILDRVLTYLRAQQSAPAPEVNRPVMTVEQFEALTFSMIDPKDVGKHMNARNLLCGTNGGGE